MTTTASSPTPATDPLTGVVPPLVCSEQDRIAALFEIVFQPVGKTGPAAGVGAFKTALRELGVLTTNEMTTPMSPIDGEAVGRIRTILEQAGLLDGTRA